LRASAKLLHKVLKKIKDSQGLIDEDLEKIAIKVFKSFFKASKKSHQKLQMAMNTSWARANNLNSASNDLDYIQEELEEDIQYQTEFAESSHGEVDQMVCKLRFDCFDDKLMLLKNFNCDFCEDPQLAIENGNVNKRNLEKILDIHKALDEILRDNHEIWLDLANSMVYMEEFEKEIKKAEEHLIRQERTIFFFNANFDGQFENFLAKLEDTSELPELYRNDNNKN